MIKPAINSDVGLKYRPYSKFPKIEIQRIIMYIYMYDAMLIVMLIAEIHAKAKDVPVYVLAYCVTSRR